MEKKPFLFNVKKLERLNNPERKKLFPVGEVTQITGLENPEYIIDYGAGTGLFSREWAVLFPKARIYAADISPEMIAWMEEHIVRDFPMITPLRLGIKETPLFPGIADLLFMVNLHHELPDPPSVLAEAHTLLKKGGVIALSDWRKEPMPSGPPLDSRYSEEEMAKQLKEAGFDEVSIHPGFGPNSFIWGRKG